MKIIEPKDLHDHTIRFEHTDRMEVYQILIKNKVLFKPFNLESLVVKKEGNKFLDDSSIKGFGHFEVYYHNDIGKFIDCRPETFLQNSYEEHSRKANELHKTLSQLRDIKESLNNTTKS